MRTSRTSIALMQNGGVFLSHTHEQGGAMTFGAWRRQHKRARSASGDLARDALSDPERPWTLRHTQEWDRYLRTQNACEAALDTFQCAWETYRRDMAHTSTTASRRSLRRLFIRDTPSGTPGRVVPAVAIPGTRWSTGARKPSITVSTTTSSPAGEALDHGGSRAGEGGRARGSRYPKPYSQKEVLVPPQMQFGHDDSCIRPMKYRQNYARQIGVRRRTV
jgi:hypothetical protein